MKRVKTLIVVMLILLVAFLLVQSVEAQRRGGGPRGGGRGYYGGYAHGYPYGYYGRYGYGWRGYPYWWGYSYWWGYPYWWSSPYYSYYDPYYYGGYGEPPVPPEGGSPPAASGQQQSSYWHFCQNPEGYYPYVKDCPGGWLTVVPSKPNAAPPAKLERKPVSASVEQGLIREGFFALKLAEGLRIGEVKSETEAENKLTLLGIAPKNGWIADYPLTPNIIRELRNGVGEAADSNKIAMNKDEAIKMFEGLVMIYPQ